MNSKRLTDDGLEVPAEYKLGFTILTFEYLGWSGVFVAAQLEWNRDGERRRPYLVIDLGPVHLQTGWLWYLPTTDSSVLNHAEIRRENR